MKKVDIKSYNQIVIYILLSNTYAYWERQAYYQVVAYFKSYCYVN